MSFQVSFTADKIVFVDKNGKAENMELFDVMADDVALRAITNEQKAAQSASKAAVSLLSHILDNPRLGGYRGQTPINENVPSELKSAIRELETEYLKPIFVKSHTDKGAKPATVEKLWQEFSGGLRAGGSFATAKTEVTKYFAQCGQLPVTENGKLLSIAAIKKLLQNAREQVAKPEKTGIAGKLVTLSQIVHDTTDDEALGDFATGIAALKAMLSVYETKHTEALETLTAVIGNVDSTAKAVVSKMKRAPEPVLV